MKAKYTFEIMELDDGMVAVPVGCDSEQFHGVLKVNETAAAILKLLEKETTEEEIVNDLQKEYEGSKEDIVECVREYIEKLTAENIIA